MTAPVSTAVIRQWARNNDLTVGERGRLSPQVLTAYASAGPSRPDAPLPGSALPRQAQRGQGVVAVRVRPTPGATGVGRRVVARHT